VIGDIQGKILGGLYLALIPIVRCLLRSGIGYREFAKICKVAFVKVATEDYGIRGRPTNISRVAVMTGLTRKEVKKVRDSDIADISQLYFTSPPSEVLNQWHTDSEYLTDDSRPKVIPYEGPTCSFTALVKRRAGDIPPGAMRTELKRVGAIEELSDGMLKVIKRAFVPSGVDDRLLEGLYALRTLADTVSFNSNRESLTDTRFQQIAETYLFDSSRLPELRKVSRKKLQSYSDDFMNLLSKNEVDELNVEDDGISVGLGIYYFEVGK